MACSTRPGPSAALAFLANGSQPLTQSDWHAVRTLVSVERAGGGTRARADQGTIDEVVSALAGSAARRRGVDGALGEGSVIPWGWVDPDDYGDMPHEAQKFTDEVVTLRQALSTSGLTEGNAVTLRALADWSPERAVRRARALTSVPYTPSSGPAPEEVLAVVDSVNNMSDDIWFESANWMHSDGDEVALGDMRDPLWASNNCHNATMYAADAIWEDDLTPEGWTSSKVETLHIDPNSDAGSGVHWANVLTCPDGERWVIDYTARQFGGDVPFPMVERYEKWLDHVSQRTEAIYGSRLENVYQHGRHGDREILWSLTGEDVYEDVPSP